MHIIVASPNVKQSIIYIKVKTVLKPYLIISNTHGINEYLPASLFPVEAAKNLTGSKTKPISPTVDWRQ